MPCPGRCQPREPWPHPVGLPQVPKPEEQKQQVEVPEPTPTPSSSSRDVTTVTLLLRAPPRDTPSPPASADGSPTTTSPEPPLEPAEEALCPAPEALGSPEPPPSPPRATSPEPQEPPATPSTDGQVVDKVSRDEGRGCQAGEVPGLGVRPLPTPCLPCSSRPAPRSPLPPKAPPKVAQTQREQVRVPAAETARASPSLPAKWVVVPGRLQHPRVQALSDTASSHCPRGVPAPRPAHSPPPMARGSPAALKGNGPQAHSFPQKGSAPISQLQPWAVLARGVSPFPIGREDLGTLPPAQA